jgi:serine/threonine protein kinase
MFQLTDPKLSYRRVEVLGCGNFGYVYKGIARKYDGNEAENDVAIKVLNYSEEQFKEQEKELFFLKSLRCPYVVNFIDSYVFRGEIWIIMELCACALSDLIQVTGTGTIGDERALQGIIANW